jgi:uncharacterized membrane protein
MRSRWLIFGLVASVVLNLFLIGAAAGVIALGMNMAKDGARPGAFMVATQGLPAADRRAMRLMLRQARDATLPDIDRSLAVRAAAWGALADPKPDLVAIKLQLAQSRELDIAVRTRVEEQIADYAAGLSPANRATFAAGMRRALHPHPDQSDSSPPAANAPATDAPAAGASASNRSAQP